jgi:hypothetical protein
MRARKKTDTKINKTYAHVNVSVVQQALIIARKKLQRAAVIVVALMRPLKLEFILVELRITDFSM